MRSNLRWLFPALAIAAASCSDDETGERRLVVLFTTDEHSQLFASAPEQDDFPLPSTPGTGALQGGVARRMTILAAERAAARARSVETITVSAGDFSQGSLASAAWLATSPELVMMKRMGYDAVALGNHEFDLGPGALAQAIASAGDALPPLVLTNLTFDPDDARDDALAGLYGPGQAIAPYRVLTTASGLRVGIVASMGVAAGTVAGSAPPVTFWTGETNEARFSSVALAVFSAAKHLREVERVDAVILLAHGGIGPTPLAPGEDELLAEKVLGIDLVVSGHSHRATPEPRMISAYGREIPVVQAAAYGREVGRVELVFRDGVAVPSLDPAATAFLPVDDRTLPTTDAAFLGELHALTMGFLESGVPGSPAPSFLEATLSRVLGTTVTDDPARLGDLWFTPLGKTAFDVIGLAPGETNAMNLDADAMLAAAAANGFPDTVAALQASGPIRGDLRVGASGDITFADVYQVAPLGGDPTAGTDLNAVPGYPLVRVLVPTAALRAAIEGTLQQALLDGDFFVGASGLLVHYDMTRPPFDPATQVGPGWVTSMSIVNGETVTKLYDVDDPTFAQFASFAQNPADPTWVQPIVTTYYVASFASAFGIPLVDPTDGQLISPTNPLADTILRRGDESAVKDHESLAAFVKAACEGNSADPGFLPAIYSSAFPSRMIDCTGGCASAQ
jgi:5'-nucleotidase